MDPVVYAVMLLYFADWWLAYRLGVGVGYYRGLNEGHATARRFQELTEVNP